MNGLASQGLTREIAGAFEGVWGGLEWIYFAGWFGFGNGGVWVSQERDMRRPGDSCFPPIAFDKGAMDGAPAGLWLRENNMLETVIGRSRRLSQALKRGVSADGLSPD
jgi:hypothetical protein